MTAAAPPLWDLTFGRPEIDPTDLAAAIEREASQPDLDFRTRLLVRDSLNALQKRWGEQRMSQWLDRSAQGASLLSIWKSDLGPAGFPALERRLMEATRPQTVRQLLRELGMHLARPTRIYIGGAIALILRDYLTRNTEDIDVVDEVPPEIRSQHELLDQLAERYGLRITHFQSHYLPAGWAERVESLERFGNLDVFLVDPYDAFVGKLFSAREKDRDDLRMLAPRLDRSTIETRLRAGAAALLAQPTLADNARRNWYIVFGDALPA